MDLIISSKAIGLASIITIAGCASHAPVPSTPENLAAIASSVAAGSVRLTCSTFSCAGTWGSTRRKVKGLYEQGLWADLAIEIVNVQFDSDLAYFYLARAAEGLGKPQAAVVYYKQALASTGKCDHFIDNCDGIPVGKLATEALERLLPPGQRPSSMTPKNASLQPSATYRRDA